MKDKKMYMGLDVGGSKVSAALVDLKGQMYYLRRHTTPATGQETMDLLIEMGQELQERASENGATIPGVGIGFGGPVDYPNQRLRRSFHKEGWDVNQPLAQQLGAAFGLPVRMDNDANTAGLGEALFGAGKGKRKILYINVGTGIGGALIREQELVHGSHSNAGEIGHCVVQKDGNKCACGHNGCLEAYASGTVMGERARELLKKNPDTDTMLAEKDIEEITGEAVGDAAVEGDEFAKRIVADAAEWLGLGAANACNIWDPDAVIIGGGVSRAGETLMAPFRKAFRTHATRPVAEEIELLLARLGYDAGVVGGAALALTTL
ncbi:MAG: ROK family protein [Armatimonadota bacterium]